MARIFISYKRRNKKYVFKVIEYIESQLGIKCWVDLDGIESSRQFASVICSAIDASEVVLFMHSSSHLDIDFENDWTIKELNYAHAKNKRIVLLKTDDAKLDNIFLMEYGSKNNIDTRDKAQLDKLISDLRNWLRLPAENHYAPTAQNTSSTNDCTPEEMEVCRSYLEKYVGKLRVSTERKEMEQKIESWAKQGKTEAEYTLGYSNFKPYGHNIRVGGDNHYRAAELWLSKAANKGHIQAQSALAEMYYWGNEKDKAVPFAIEASRKGDLMAAIVLAWSYRFDNDVKYLEAIRQAAEMQKSQKSTNIHCPAMEYGKVLMEGRIIPKDLNKAIQWFDVAIELAYDGQCRAYAYKDKAEALYQQGHKIKALNCLNNISDDFSHIWKYRYDKIKSELNPMLRILF